MTGCRGMLTILSESSTGLAEGGTMRLRVILGPETTTLNLGFFSAGGADEAVVD